MPSTPPYGEAPQWAPPTPTCVIIAGPTAVGKTALAIRVARHFQTEIISADSRQCFRELDIGVAKPSAEQLEAVRHYFISTHSLNEEVNAALFESYALRTVNEIFQRNRVAVMVGGTGLYIRAFCEGLDEMPAIAPEIRQGIQEEYRQAGLEWLQRTLTTEDPQYAANGEMQNPQRMLRALEVKRATGRSIRSYQQGRKLQRPFSIVKVGLDLPREILYRQINQRVDDMLNMGLEAEVRELMPWRHLNALQTVGYAEWLDYFEGKIPVEEVAAQIKKHTRQYARRQLTWFRRDAAMQWFSPYQFDELISYLASLGVVTAD